MEDIIEQLKDINAKLDTIIDAVKKPENRMARVFEIAAAGVGILGILSVIDIIRNWILGGWYVFSNSRKHCFNTYKHFSVYDRPVHTAASIRAKTIPAPPGGFLRPSPSPAACPAPYWGSVICFPLRYTGTRSIN
jgi:hypothetical protein